MDKDKAKFVLRSFRPGGTDSQDVDFAKALNLAISDRELGEWLTRELAFDAAFAEALARVELPEGLREKVFLAMVQDSRGLPQIDSKLGAFMISAITSIAVPIGLRAEVLAAVERTAKIERGSFGWKRVGVPLAAASGIVLAFILVDGGKPDNNFFGGNTPKKIAVEALQSGFIRIHDSPRFSLDQEEKDLPHLISYLREKGLPCGGGYLPPGLEGIKGLGCRELVIDGIRGSLICFNTEHGKVHLVIFRRTEVADDLPEIDDPVMEQSGDWAKASWHKDKYAFSLMSVTDKDSLARFF